MTSAKLEDFGQLRKSKQFEAPTQNSRQLSISHYDPRKGGGREAKRSEAMIGSYKKGCTQEAAFRKEA